MDQRIRVAQELLESSGVAVSGRVRGCAPGQVRALEKAIGLTLPATYVEFLLAMGVEAGRLFRGTDFLYDTLPSIQAMARELIAEDGAELPADAFVFAMHQGYQFLFFRTRGPDDPAVFRFLEGEIVQEVAGRFSDWLIMTIENEARLSGRAE